MVFQFLNNIQMRLAAATDSKDKFIIVLDEDLSEAQKYVPGKQLSLTLVGDEHLDQYEIVYVTARTGTTFTVLRGRKGQ